MRPVETRQVAARKAHERIRTVRAPCLGATERAGRTQDPDLPRKTLDRREHVHCFLAEIAAHTDLERYGSGSALRSAGNGARNVPIAGELFHGPTGWRRRVLKQRTEARRSRRRGR